MRNPPQQTELIVYRPRERHQFPTAFGPASLEVGHDPDQVVLTMSPEAARTIARVLAAADRSVTDSPELHDVAAHVVVDLMACAALAEPTTAPPALVAGSLGRPTPTGAGLRLVGEHPR